MNEFFHYFEGNHMWFSPPFYTHMRGFKFGLCVFPRGKGTGKDTHMSVGVCLMAGEHDDLLTFPPKGKIHVKLVNQIGNHGHICGVYQFQGVTDKSIIGPVDNGADYARLALSIDQFVPISQLDHNPETNTQFLIENKLYFTVSQTEFPHQRI
jgi:TNF receptor-associated factor 4